LLEETLQAMLLDDEDISARGAVRRMGGMLRHPSDITRNAERRALLDACRLKQVELRSMMEKADKTSKKNLSAALAQKDARIEELLRDRDLLIASCRAAVLAVGEMGGMQAWLKFYKGHQAALERLNALGAVPSADITSLPTARGV
jgi:hypothetical protein